MEKLFQLPLNHFHVLVGVTIRSNRPSEESVQPVETTKVHETLQNEKVPSKLQLSERAIRDIVTDLETMGLVETWIDSRGNEGRVKQIKMTLNPQWVRDVRKSYLEESDQFEGLYLDE